MCETELDLFSVRSFINSPMDRSLKGPIANRGILNMWCSIHLLQCSCQFWKQVLKASFRMEFGRADTCMTFLVSNQDPFMGHLQLKEQLEVTQCDIMRFQLRIHQCLYKI